jgi:hypothetical protein
MPVEDGLVVEAREAYAALFPHGTTFLLGTAADVEVEGGRTLGRAREKAIAASLMRLGFAPVVRQATKELGLLRAASEAAAAVPEERPKEGPTRFDALVDATATLRAYARIVQAVDVVAGTSERHALLAPLVHRRATKAKRARATLPDPTPRANDTERDEAPPSRAA